MYLVRLMISGNRILLTVMSTSGNFPHNRNTAQTNLTGYLQGETILSIELPQIERDF